MSHALVIGGRVGDILNILPLARHLSSDGVTLVVAKAFEDVKHYITYAEVDPVSCSNEDIHGLMKYASRKYNRILVPQCYGWNYSFTRHRRNFCAEAYHKCSPSYGDRFERGEFNEVILDGPRMGDDYQLEMAQHCRSPDGRPQLLLNLEGQSSPFDGKQEWWEYLHQELPDWHITNLGGIRFRTAYDLVALYRYGNVLLTVDTATLHLARAARIPYISLTNDRNGGWYRSPRFHRCLLDIGYSEAGARMKEAVARIRSHLEKFLCA